MKELSIRRPYHTRSEYEAYEDFNLMVDLKAQGLTFEEITLALNDKRDYKTNVKENRSLYFKLFKSLALTQKAQASAEEEKERILDDLDWVLFHAQRKWQSLKDVDYQDEISGKVDGDDGPDATFDEEGNEVPVPKKKWSKKKVGLVEQHQAKYLDIILKVVQMRAKFVGLDQLEGKDLTIIEILKSRTLDDGGKASTPALRSEDEVRALYMSAAPVFNIDDSLDITPLDEYTTY